MAKVIISRDFEKQVNKVFKEESVRIFSLMLSLEENPRKGKEVGVVGNIVVKELKYGKFRLYFITDRYKIKFLCSDEIKDLLIKFVRMSGKKDQSKVIGEIKHTLRLIDEDFSS